MSALLIFLTALRHCFLTACIAFFDLGRLLTLVVRPRAALAAENVFLRKTQIWIAVSVYVLVAIVRKRLELEVSLYQKAWRSKSVEFGMIGDN
jgi:hypothetical protein